MKLKILLVSVSAAFIFASSAMSAVSLNTKHTNLGDVVQKNYEVYSKTFEIERNHKTPKRTSVSISFSYEASVCVHSHLAVGAYSSARVCDRYAWRVVKKTERFGLHFRHAKVLAPGEVETYSLYFEQEHFRSPELKMTATAISHPDDYVISKTSLFREFTGAKFSYKH